jgi:hypothetical protein
MNQPINEWSPAKFRLFMFVMIASGAIGAGLGMMVGDWSYEFIKAHGGLAVMLSGWFQ